MQSLYEGAREGRCSCEHEPKGRLLRQRGNGVVLRYAQGRVDRFEEIL